MSNRIEDDPVGHTAKFLWILSAVPLIFQAILLALPSPNVPPWARYNGFVAAAVMVAIGYGVHRRSLLAARVGMVVFGLAAAALAASAIFRHEGNRAGVVLALLPIWAVIKLHAAAGAMTPPSA